MQNNIKLFLILSAIFFLTGCSTKQPVIEQITPTIPPGKILFVSKSCPHCTVLKQYIAENNILQKVYFVIRDVAVDKDAHDLMPVVGQKCGLQYSDLVIPLFWDGQKCYLGNNSIENYFKTLP